MARLAVTPLALEAWARRRRRARQLAERHAFAGEMLQLYGTLLDVQERAFLKTLDDRPEPGALAEYVAAEVLADIADATVQAGPPPLVVAVRERLRDAAPVALIAKWLAGIRQGAVEEYLARAAVGPALEALGPIAGAACTGPIGDGACPRCGGLPQLSYLSDAGEALVSGPRTLLCCRCGEGWVHQRMTCPGCGEQTSGKLPIFADVERFPQLRADACDTCRRYVITVDLRKDPEAVPVVDELAALPLDLHVQERGFAKIVPNLMAIG
jgi:formate dehydrogenase maturation protein FdhE